MNLHEQRNQSIINSLQKEKKEKKKCSHSHFHPSGIGPLWRKNSIILQKWINLLHRSPPAVAGAAFFPGCTVEVKKGGWGLLTGPHSLLALSHWIWTQSCSFMLRITVCGANHDRRKTVSVPKATNRHKLKKLLFQTSKSSELNIPENVLISA